MQITTLERQGAQREEGPALCISVGDRPTRPCAQRTCTIVSPSPSIATRPSSTAPIAMALALRTHSFTARPAAARPVARRTLRVQVGMVRVVVQQQHQQEQQQHAIGVHRVGGELAPALSRACNAAAWPADRLQAWRIGGGAGLSAGQAGGGCGAPTRPRSVRPPPQLPQAAAWTPALTETELKAAGGKKVVELGGEVRREERGGGGSQGLPAYRLPHHALPSPSTRPLSPFCPHAARAAGRGRRQGVRREQQVHAPGAGEGAGGGGGSEGVGGGRARQGRRSGVSLAATPMRSPPCSRALVQPLVGKTALLQGEVGGGCVTW